MRKRWPIQQKEIRQNEHSSSRRTEVENAEGQLGQPGEKTFVTLLSGQATVCIRLKSSWELGKWGSLVLEKWKGIPFYYSVQSRGCWVGTIERYCFKLRYPAGLNTNNYKPGAQIPPAMAPDQRLPREAVVENKRGQKLTSQKVQAAGGSALAAMQKKEQPQPE